MTGTQKARTEYFLAKNLVTLKEAMPLWADGVGIFEYLTGFEFNPDADTATVLDLDYYGNYSGDKVASKLIHQWVDDESGELPITAFPKLASMVRMRYAAKWNILWDQYAIQPWFDNVKIIESTAGTETGTEAKATKTVESETGVESESVNTASVSNDSSTSIRTGDVERKEGGATSQSETETGSSVSETAHRGTVVEAEQSSGLDRTFGFNSGDAGVKKDSTIAENANTQTFNNTDTLTETPNKNSSSIISHGRTTSEKYNNLSDVVAGSGNRNEDRTRSLSNNHARNNNIDSDKTSNVITSGTRILKGFDYRRQDRIQYLIQLFENPNLLPFFENLYNDVDKILCLPVFK